MYFLPKWDKYLKDEIESITSTTDITMLSNLQKENDNIWHCPIIYISNNQHNKVSSKIKKDIGNVKFYKPFASDVYKILKNIAIGEQIKLQSEVVYKIISYVKSDIRQLIFTLYNLKKTYKDKGITEKLFNDFIEISDTKDDDPDLFDATKKLLYKYTNVNDCLRCYETEKVLLPLMMHQYYVKCILLNQRITELQYDMIDDIAISLSYGDVVENMIYGDQNWDMKDVHGFYTCVYPSYTLSNNFKPNMQPLQCDLKFATDLNKTSIKKINKRNINNANKCMENMDIMDYIYINKIVKDLLKDGNIEVCSKLFRGYDIKLEHIESLLKIDKLRTDNTQTKPTLLKSKQRKEFITYLNGDTPIQDNKTKKQKQKKSKQNKISSSN